MKVLIVASYNLNRFSPFVLEQAATLTEEGVDIQFFGIKGRGINGYLLCREFLLKKIKEYEPDIIHAHYGLSGLLANLQRKIPVITTFHGSDIHSNRIILFLSKIAMKLSAYNIFVGQNLFNLSKYSGSKYIIQSCGIDLSIIRPIEVSKARELLGWSQDKIYILFSGSFDNRNKNYALAQKSVELVGNCILVELKGYEKKEVSLLMNASNLLLVTSLRESGPLVVKEAMSCNKAIVTTDVGDVKWVIGDTAGCFVTLNNVSDCTVCIQKAIQFSLENKLTKGRDRIIEIGLDSKDVAQKIVGIYNNVLLNGKK